MNRMIIIIFIILNIFSCISSAETIKIGHDGFYQDFEGIWHPESNENFIEYPYYLYTIEGNSWNISRMGMYTKIPIRSWINYSFEIDRIKPVYIINSYDQIDELVTKVNSTVWYLTIPFSASHVISKTDKLIDMGVFNRTLDFDVVDANNISYQFLIKVIDNDIRIYFHPQDYLLVAYPLTFLENTITVKLQDADIENLDDSFISIFAPDFNFNGYNYTKIGGVSSYPYRSLIKFNLTTLPENIIINHSELFMYEYSANVGIIGSVHEVLDDSWGEETVTWNNQPGYNATPESSNNTLDTIGWKEFSVTNMVNNAHTNLSNVSILVTSDTYTKAISFYSKEYLTDTSKRPYLNITYTEEEVYPNIHYLKGYINNTLGYYLEGVRVDINGNYTFTDGIGYYHFIDLSSGNYSILVRQIGYDNITDTINISVDTSMNYTLTERTGVTTEDLNNTFNRLFLLIVVFTVLSTAMIRRLLKR